jgi:hypothetical protein
LGKGGGGRPRGSPRSRFDGLEGAWEGPAGQLGGTRRRPPRWREIPARPGRIRAMRGRGGVLGVPGRCGGSWTATDGQGGRAHRAALMAAGGGVKQRVGRKLGRRGRSSGRLPLYGRHACTPGYRICPRLNSPYGVSSTGARREPAADRWATQSATGGEGKGSTWRGTDSRGPRSAPHLGQRGLGTARGP